MRYKFTYCLVLIVLAFAAGNGSAQSCEKNMLVTPNVSSYGVIPNPKGITLTGAFTIEFWAQSSSFAANSGLIEQLNKGDTGAFSIGFGSGDYLVVTLRLNNGITTLTTPNISNIQNWKHYGLTFTPNDSIRVYVNGILIASQATTANKLVASTDSILLAHSGLSGITFTGNIDELRIWSTARTSAEILASMSVALSGTEAGLKAYYSFDDDSAKQNIHDFSGGKSEGYLVSSASLAVSTSPVTGTTHGYMLASKELRIIFPELICATEADTVIHVYNRGHEDVQIDPAAFQSGKVFSPTTTVFILSADSAHIIDIHIQANPTTPGLYRDTLIIRSTTICGGILRIPVEIRYQKIAIAFDDSIFSLRFGATDLLPCDLPRPSQTSLHNTGTKAATIISLQFSPFAGIRIDSPITPFTIDPGKSQDIHFTVLPGSAGPISTTLTASTSVSECSRTAKIAFVGNRIVPQFSIPDHITFPDIHLPPPGVVLDTTIILKNTGTTTLSMNPPLELVGGLGFSLLLPQSGLAAIRPDSNLIIKIRLIANECGPFATSLHFQDQKNCGIDTLIPISINILGPDVSAQSSTFDLGARCGTHDTTITLVNKSGRTIVLGKPVFSQDSILSLTGGTLPKSLSPGDSITITIHFAPSEPGMYGVDAHFPLSPCGESQLHFDGILGVGKIALSDSSLDFGNGCDLLTQTRTLTITNHCGRQISVTNATPVGSQNFSIISLSLPFSMANNESTQITIQFTPKQLGTLEQTRISLYDNGCFVTRFTARAVRERARIEWNPGIGAEYGKVCPGQATSETITLRNLGYGDDTVSSYRVLIDPSVFRVATMNDSVIFHGASKQFTVIFSPKDTGNYWDYLQVVLSPCGDTTRIALHGIGGPAPILLVSDSILNFRTIKVGTTDSLCTVLQNPSCLPLPIAIDSVHTASSVFSVSQSTRKILPDSVVDSAPLTFCFVFAPDKIGSFETRDTIRIGNSRKIITLRGTAGVSDLKYDQRIIDFGDVLKDSIKKRALAIHNSGSYAALLSTLRQPDPDFTHDTNSQTVGGTSYDTIVFHPKYLGPQRSFIIYGWENNQDTIFLRGRGIQPGLSFGSSLIDFSKRRVGHDSTIRIGVTNTLDTQIIIRTDSITGKYSVSPLGSKLIYPQDTIYYTITYSPDAEMIDTASLYLVTDNSGKAVLPIRGEGVEAHLFVGRTNINFGDLGLQQTKYDTLKISNTGGYPLAIAIHNNVAEFNSAVGSAITIPPDSSADYFLSFTPQRAIPYIDTLHIDADAPEKTASVSLKGKGVFQPLGIPEVNYSIPDKQAKVGDIVTIPISIGGKDLALFNIDSFHVDLTYDPTVIYFLDTIVTSKTLSAGFTMKFERLSHDSIIRISGSGKQIIATPERLFILQAMALLGQHDSTRIIVQSADPQNTADLLLSSGSFVITDCNNYRGGILFKGNYSVSRINPNPVSSIAHIEYEIGLPARVHLDLFDALGRHIRTIIDEDETKGKHSATFSSDDIPSGEYIYLFKSLEYETRGAMIIAK